jgi:hypothetical protein
VPFPDIRGFPESYPGRDERDMGGRTCALLRLFRGRVPDAESHAHVLELADTPSRWSAGRAVFDEVRCRLLGAMNDRDEARIWQHRVEESCCKAMYNATKPRELFTLGDPRFVPWEAVCLARVVGVPVEDVFGVLAPEA